MEKDSQEQILPENMLNAINAYQSYLAANGGKQSMNLGGDRKPLQVQDTQVTKGIKATVDYGVDIPGYQYHNDGINIRFEYENKAQIEMLDTYFRVNIYPGCAIYGADSTGKWAGTLGKADRVGGVCCGQNLNNCVDSYLNDLIKKGVIVSVDNITINGKYDEIAQKVVAAKVAEMKLAYEKKQTQSQNKNQDNGMEM